MADRDIRSLFELLDGSPDSDFRSQLRATVLEAVDAVGPSSPKPHEEGHTMVELDSSNTGGRRRTLALVAAAAAVVVAVVVASVALSGSDAVVTDDSVEPVSQTTTATETTIPVTSSTNTTTATTATTTTVTTTTEPVSTTAERSGPHPTLPAIVPAGTHQLVDAVVPFELTLAQPWERRLDFEERLLLARAGVAGEEELLLLFDQVGDSSADSILPLVCPESVELADPAPIEVLGEAGFVVTGSTTVECALGRVGGSGFFVAAESSIVIAAVTVGDHVFVIVADAPSAAGTGFVDEAIATIASISRID